jgi:DNA-binding protein H-NS
MRSLPRKILGRDYSISNRPDDLPPLNREFNYHHSINVAGERDAQATDLDGELKALHNKARELKSRKVEQLGELVIATGADSLSADELAGALIVLAATKDNAMKEAWAKRGAAFFRSRARRTAPATERDTGGVRARPAARNRQQAEGAA